MVDTEMMIKALKLAWIPGHLTPGNPNQTENNPRLLSKKSRGSQPLIKIQLCRKIPSLTAGVLWKYSKILQGTNHYVLS